MCYDLELDIKIYKGDFENWQDVIDSFGCNEPEPEQVLLAEYDTYPYEGYAIVVYRNGNKFFVVEGSHCSCYGLEGEWQPEEYDRETFIAAMKLRNDLAYLTNYIWPFDYKEPQ